MPRVTAARFRALVLSMPDAIEGEHQAHPDFRVNGRIFATLHADGLCGMVKLPLTEQSALTKLHPEVFVPASGAWGRAGCTNVVLAKVPVAVLSDAISSAWQLAMAMPATRGKKKAAPARRPPRADDAGT